ncbi:cysteine desulfurase family protein [Parvularcula dongshanensis]|uniref:Cysteine desulfurase n=1 Tax=Parvularcula dongshanensis TaxID=1173995 RepID=A0A840I0K5_9PROT|nr:cysteine desulfurase family protein [Parvularcula dongshanensis]MBB4657640.1 cysteine desulfurase [Parvularcula dongshanensis]
MADRLYLDHNATSPLRPQVREAMLAAMDAPRNASSVHAEGRAAKRLVEDARAKLAEILSAPRESVVFTAGGTEADNTGVLGMVGGGPKVRRLFVSAIEHEAVSVAAEHAGVPVEIVPVTPQGALDLSWLGERLSSYDAETDGPFLLCVMLANNETGVIQPVAEAARLARRAGGYVLCDAVQALFKLPVDFSTLGADLLTVSAHKAGGPVGVGALVVTPGLAFEPLLRGGGQEEYRRAGTHNVAAIAGLGALCDVASLDDYARLEALRDEIEAGLPPEATVWGRGAPRLANTLCLSAPGFRSETQVMAMDLSRVAASAGSACSSGKVRPSPVLRAMGASEAEAGSALRISMGWDTADDAPARFLAAWNKEYERIARRAA